MKNAARIAIVSATIALGATAPVHAEELAAEVAAFDTGMIPLFAKGELDLPSDPAADAFLTAIGGDASMLIGGPATTSDVDLDANRGGYTMVVGNQTLDAITSGNSIGGSVIAGAVSVSDAAFSNFNGIGNIAINTGTQVTLQSGINLIINLSQ